MKKNLLKKTAIENRGFLAFLLIAMLFMIGHCFSWNLIPAVHGRSLTYSYEGESAPLGKKRLEKISINHADLKEIIKLPGINTKKAQKIIEKRQEKPFTKIEDLLEVNGIGPKTLEEIRPYITL